jgi:hypothetical protein
LSQVLPPSFASRFLLSGFCSCFRNIERSQCRQGSEQGKTQQIICSKQLRFATSRSNSKQRSGSAPGRQNLKFLHWYTRISSIPRLPITPSTACSDLNQHHMPRARRRCWWRRRGKLRPG